MKKEEIKIM